MGVDPGDTCLVRCKALAVQGFGFFHHFLDFGSQGLGLGVRGLAPESFELLSTFPRPVATNTNLPAPEALAKILNNSQIQIPIIC